MLPRVAVRVHEVQETFTGARADQVREWFTAVEGPGFGRVSSASDVRPTADGSRVAFIGHRFDGLEGAPAAVVCVLDSRSGVVREISAGPRDQRPRWSPSGEWLAYLSDGATRGAQTLTLIRPGDAEPPRRLSGVPGSVEYAEWSPSGAGLLLGVAAAGLDLAGGQGSGTITAADAAGPEWAPDVRRSGTGDAWRSCVAYEPASGSLRQIFRGGVNVWEACWLGDDAVAAIVSESPGEESWYIAELVTASVSGGATRTLYRSAVQLGVPCGSPSGRHVAVLEALCSDRQVIAGGLVLVDVAAGTGTPVDTLGVDVSSLSWESDDVLVFAGLRGLEVVAGRLDLRSGAVAEVWRTTDSCGVRYPEIAVVPDGGLFAVVDGYHRHYEIVRVAGGVEQTLLSFRHDGTDYLEKRSGRLQALSWTAPDGLTIQGLLVQPDGTPPFPLVVDMHGGPVWAWRNRWGLRNATRQPIAPVLAAAGYAVLQVNPRGSTGRGGDFAARVCGDMGGQDTGDFVSGIDHVVGAGIADPNRIGLTGISYGGYMTNWLITQHQRFAAAVAVAPTSNWLSQHYTSNLGRFDRLFLGDDPFDPRGRYWTRSPLHHAANVRTPLLQIAGALDRCSPASEALQFHQALAERGMTSELVVYPGEGHGVVGFPATLDYIARLIDWFDRFMPA